MRLKLFQADTRAIEAARDAYRALPIALKSALRDELRDSAEWYRDRLLETYDEFVQTRTGTLRRAHSVSVEPSKLRFAVGLRRRDVSSAAGGRAYYAPWVHNGTVKAAARPWVEVTFERYSAEAIARRARIVDRVLATAGGPPSISGRLGDRARPGALSRVGRPAANQPTLEVLDDQSRLTDLFGLDSPSDIGPGPR